MKKTFIIAEIGINHNGDINIAKRLIDGAVEAGCDAVKFQKRTIELVYSKEELDKPRESPWGTTNGEQKNGLEFSEAKYDEIDSYCKEKKIIWFASPWDLESVKFLEKYNLPYNKVASAMLTNKEVVKAIAVQKKYTFISTGMSTIEQIYRICNLFTDAACPFELMHCNSTYPMAVEDANLLTIPFLKNIFGCNVGYSGHETGIIVSCAAVAMGATSIERHISIDRAMYGSDQSASLEIDGLKRLVRYIRSVEKAFGEYNKIITDKEKEIEKKLRKVNTL